MKPGYQFLDYPQNLFRPLCPFQSQELRDKVLAFIQLFSRHSAFVQQKMPMLGTIILQTLRHGSEQGATSWGAFHALPPLYITMGNTGGNPSFSRTFPVLTRSREAGSIGQRQGHPVVRRTLELQKQRHIAPSPFSSRHARQYRHGVPAVSRHITSQTAFKRREV